MVLIKYSAIQKNISTKFGNYGNDLHAIFVFVQYFGKIWIVRQWKALGLEEISLTSCPPLERFLLTISSIWCHLWKSTQARPMRFSARFSALESSVDKPTTWAGKHVLAPPFFILNCETFPDILFADKQLSRSKWLFIIFWKRCGIITKWMKP